jgi:SAM-dependent methyltransferase
MNEVAISRGRRVLVQGAFSLLPWIDEMSHKVLLVNVAYFFDADGRDISEAYRVLRSGGRLVIYVTSRDLRRRRSFSSSRGRRLSPIARCNHACRACLRRQRLHRGSQKIQALDVA